LLQVVYYCKQNNNATKLLRLRAGTLVSCGPHIALLLLLTTLLLMM